MTIGRRLVACGAFALLALASLNEASAQSASADTQWSAAWPKPSESALNLVRLMREDEVVLLAVRQAVEKDRIKARCAARLRPENIASAIGSVIMLQMSPAEIDEAVRFFQSEAGRKITEIKVSHVRDRVNDDVFDPRVLDLARDERHTLAEFSRGSAAGKIKSGKIQSHIGIRAEVYDSMSRCESVLKGETRSVFCVSTPVSSPNRECEALYVVTRRAGEKLPQTNVHVNCKTESATSASYIADLEGQHETIGFAWRDDKLLEVLLPAGAKVLRKQTEDYRGAQHFIYRTRKPADAPAAACERNPNFLDPNAVD